MSSLHDLPLPKRVNVDEIVQNSFKDFHQKGFDYLCLRRSPEETVKLYFFEGDVAKLPEVVAPHDHRYDFETWVAAGAVENVWFRRSLDGTGQVFNWFEYRTPLNGGDGFEFAGEEQLIEKARARFGVGQSYFMNAEDLHTIRIAGNETVLMLVQFEDRVGLEYPTSTFFRDAAPKLDGLYSRFTSDEVIKKLQMFEQKTGHFFTTSDSAARNVA